MEVEVQGVHARFINLVQIYIVQLLQRNLIEIQVYLFLEILAAHAKYGIHKCFYCVFIVYRSAFLTFDVLCASCSKMFRFIFYGDQEVT